MKERKLSSAAAPDYSEYGNSGNSGNSNDASTPRTGPPGRPEDSVDDATEATLGPDGAGRPVFSEEFIRALAQCYSLLLIPVEGQSRPLPLAGHDPNDTSQD